MDDILKQHYLNKMKKDTEASQEGQEAPGMLADASNYIQNGIAEHQGNEKLKQDQMAQLYPDIRERLTRVHPDDEKMIQDMAGGMMGGVGKVGATAAEAMVGAKTGLSTLEQYLMKMKGLSREGGYAQRLGAEAKGAGGLSQEAGATLTGQTGGAMQDAVIKQQIANKLRGL